MKRVIFILVFLMIVNLVCACEDGQIDINSASLKELDKLYGIGESKAEEIMDSRPFDCVDDLMNVKGIGENILENIKKQGLACVDEEENSKSEDEEEIKLEEPIEDRKENAEVEVIKLNAKVIKSEKNKESLDNADYMKYGFVFFCVLAGFFVILWKKKYKTEFN